MFNRSNFVEPTTPIAPSADTTTLYWIGTYMTRKEPKLAPTDNFTQNGVRIFEKVGEVEVPTIVRVRDRIYQVSELGQPITVPTHLVGDLIDGSLVWERDENGQPRPIPGFTRDPKYARMVVDAHNSGKPIPRNLTDVQTQSTQEALSSMSVEDLREILARREAEVQEATVDLEVAEVLVEEEVVVEEPKRPRGRPKKSS